MNYFLIHFGTGYDVNSESTRLFKLTGLSENVSRTTQFFNMLNILFLNFTV